MILKDLTPVALLQVDITFVFFSTRNRFRNVQSTCIFEDWEIPYSQIVILALFFFFNRNDSELLLVCGQLHCHFVSEKFRNFQVCRWYESFKTNSVGKESKKKSWTISSTAKRKQLLFYVIDNIDRNICHNLYFKYW